VRTCCLDTPGGAMPDRRHLAVLGKKLSARHPSQPWSVCRGGLTRGSRHKNLLGAIRRQVVAYAPGGLMARCLGVDRKDATDPKSNATSGAFERPRMVVMRVIPFPGFPKLYVAYSAIGAGLPPSTEGRTSCAPSLSVAKWSQLRSSRWSLFGSSFPSPPKWVDPLGALAGRRPDLFVYPAL